MRKGKNLAVYGIEEDLQTFWDYSPERISSNKYLFLFDSSPVVGFKNQGVQMQKKPNYFKMQRFSHHLYSTAVNIKGNVGYGVLNGLVSWLQCKSIFSWNNLALLYFYVFPKSVEGQLFWKVNNSFFNFQLQFCTPKIETPQSGLLTWMPFWVI